MQENKKHISLETAKLLKDCWVESEYLFDNSGNFYTNKMPRIRLSDDTKHDGTTVGDFYPAFTWQEILWENPTEFFGEKKIIPIGYTKQVSLYEGYTDYSIGLEEYNELNEEEKKEFELDDFDYENYGYKICSEKLLDLLQQKNYKEADEYFRKNCVLIK